MYDAASEVFNDTVITIQSLHWLEKTAYQKYSNTETRQKTKKKNVLSNSNGQGRTPTKTGLFHSRYGWPTIQNNML